MISIDSGFEPPQMSRQGDASLRAAPQLYFHHQVSTLLVRSRLHASPTTRRREHKDVRAATGKCVSWCRRTQATKGHCGISARRIADGGTIQVPSHCHRRRAGPDWPAAVSDSMVGARRQVGSALLAAIAQNFSDDPKAAVGNGMPVHPGLGRGSRWERSATGAPSLRLQLLVASIADNPLKLGEGPVMGDRHPACGRAAEETCNAGAYTAPATGMRFSIQADSPGALAAALNELPGALERIETNKSIGFDHWCRRTGFFGDDREIRHVA